MNTPADSGPSRTQSILSLVVILVVIGFMWRSCWYATPLSDSRMTELLSGEGAPGQIHKALSQFKERVDNHDPDARQWYAGVAGLANHKVPQIRSTAAWAMGADPEEELFLKALRKLLKDPQIQVRYNAAVSLGAAGHPEARPVLRQMLAAHTIKAPEDGTVEEPRAQGEDVRFGQVLGRLRPSSGSRLDILAPLDGRLARVVKRHGMAVKTGDALFVLEPGEGQLGNAMIALSRCGTAEDVPVIAPVANGRFGVSEPTRRLASEALKALRKE